MAPGRCRGKRRGRGRCRCCRPADAAEASRRRGETVRLIRACRLTGVIKRDERMQGGKELSMAGLVGSSDQKKCAYERAGSEASSESNSSLTTRTL